MFFVQVVHIISSHPCGKLSIQRKKRRVGFSKSLLSASPIYSVGLNLFAVILLTYPFPSDFDIRQRDSIQQMRIIQNGQRPTDISTKVQFTFSGAGDRTAVDHLLNSFPIVESLPLTSTQNGKANL